MALNSRTTFSKASQLRLLVLTPASDNATSPSPFPFFLEKLTGTAPPSDIDTFAGYTSHPPVHLKTKYYETNVAIWCDELPPSKSETTPDISISVREDTLTSKEDNTDDASANTPTQTSSPATVPEQQSTLSDWQDQMLGISAVEVRDVIGSILLLLPFTQQYLTSSTNSTRESSLVKEWAPYIEAVSALSERIEDESGRNIPSIVLLQSINTSTTMSSDKDTKAKQALLEQTEREIMDERGVLGLDFVLWNQTTNETEATLSKAPTAPDISTESPSRNEFGEKTGFPRVLEVLEGTDWTAEPSGLDSDTENIDETTEPDDLDFLDDTPQLRPNATTNKNTTPKSYTTHTTTNTDKTHKTQRLLAHNQQEFQREMLGLKMAKLDLDDPNSAPSSLAGEFDANDFGARTPAPASRLSTRVRHSQDTTGSQNNDNDVDGERGAGGGGDGNEMAVEQLTGLMERVVAMREAASELSDAEREKFARREVRKIMKELG